MLTDGSDCRIKVVPDRDRVIIALTGEIEIGTFGAVRQVIADVRDSGFDSVVVDLRGATFLDSTGLHVVWEEHVRARTSGESFAIVDGPGMVRRLLQLTGLSLHLHRAELSPAPSGDSDAELLPNGGRFKRISEAYLRSLEHDGGDPQMTSRGPPLASDWAESAQGG